MQKSNVCRNRIFRKNTEILRVLEIRENKVLVIDCAKSRLPWWISLLDLKDAVEITEEDLLEEMGVCLAGILPFVGEKKKRSYLIEETAIRYEVSVNTMKNYLISYLVYQNITILAPKERKVEKELTQDEKNMRWALNERANPPAMLGRIV